MAEFSFPAFVAINRVFIATVLGSLLGAALRKKHSVLETILSVVSGWAVSYYLAPVLFAMYPAFGIELIAFGTGLVGMNVASILLNAAAQLEKSVASFITSYINKKLGSPAEPDEKAVEKVVSIRKPPKRYNPSDIDDIDARR